MSERQTALVLI